MANKELIIIFWATPNIIFWLPVSFGAKFLGFDLSLIIYSGIQGPPYCFFRNDYLDTNSIKFWSEGEYKMSDGTSVIRKQGEGTPEWDSTKHDRILVEETKDFLDDHMKNRADDSFFLYFSTGGEHTPHTPTKTLVVSILHHIWMCYRKWIIL